MKDFVMKGFIRVEDGEVAEAVGLYYNLESGEIGELNSIGANQEDVFAINGVFQRFEETMGEVLFIRSKQEEEGEV